MPIRQGTSNLKRKFNGTVEVNFIRQGIVLIYKSITQFASDYSARVLSDGGTVEGLANVTTTAQDLRNSDLFERLTLGLFPSGVKAGKAYSLLPENGAGDLTIVRNTTATRSNSNLVDELVGLNVPRLNYDTIGGQPYLLLEPQRTDLLLNSATLATQSITTAAVTHTLSFKGTGTVNLSGAFSGSLNGTGANNRVTLTFTPTAASLTVTISGSCTNGQLEQGAFATSFIPTSGAAVTRNQDLINKTGITDLIGQTEGVFFLEIRARQDNTANRAISISDSTSSNRISVSYPANAPTFITFLVSSQSVSINTPQFSNTGLFMKIAVRYSSTQVSFWVNGVNLSSVNGTFNFGNLNRIGADSGAGSSVFFGDIRTTQLYKSTLTDAECITLTTV